ncbi:hypothetical protein BDN70DRAFT_807721 [Pholiota conissans]|uniref:Ubiquitin-like protease family profile domain-containing protein n=1 Tax=Pholiota conissans TaxID=109636 RepID=A0A9P6D0U4_9AGAR|nr:hypothetical protein BDN70DRAFT_807721 [Pholiota conissans]
MGGDEAVADAALSINPNHQWVDEVEIEGFPPSWPTQASTPSKSPGKQKRVTPDQAAVNLYAKWQALLPKLVEPLLEYTLNSIGNPTQAVGKVLGAAACSRSSVCEVKEASVLCLYYDPNTLVRHGLFPTSPEQIRTAVSIDLLDFYSALFERSCDAVNAMATALNTFYSRRGFFLLNGKGERYKEPFRRGFGHAAQWMDGLRLLVERRTESLLQQADEYLQTCSSIPSAIPTSPFEPDLSQPAHNSNDTAPFESNRILRQLCPACFGGTRHGRPLQDGGDFQVATDGNFHHRHLVSGGESIRFHQPAHIIPKSFVDEVGDLLRQAKKTSPKCRNPKVPDTAVDECEKSHDAADGDKKKGGSSNEGRYDDMGWMSLVCRHDIPLFFANIDTPGEQQKYSVALILWLFGFIPPNATVTVLYDIGCVLDRSIQMYGLLPENIRPRIQFVTTAMHAYGHQWSCQLLYNPRLCQGLGLTDGEGVERTWSRLRKLIPLVRASSRARRIWLTDRQLSSIAYDLREDLGDWLKRRQRVGIEAQSAKARVVIEQSGMSEQQLRSQWDLQKAAQLSIRAHKPAQLKKELDAILSLQGDLDTVERAISAAKSTLASSSAPEDSKEILKNLLEMHTTFTNRVEALYVSLNIHDSYPDLRGASLDFVRTLLMARDLKISIRKRAIGSFFEWDRLDQAVGGRSQTLGTKLHQQTRRAISKRAPALLTSIKKFNAYCSKLDSMYDPSWSVPLPLPLPTKLADLRDDSSLMEDVWITPLEKASQPWLDDPDVRSGIRALIKLDRCIEEQRRLGHESDNLCAWFRRELGAVELAIRTPKCAIFSVQLDQYRNLLLHLKSRWSSPLASALRFESHVQEAASVAQRLTGSQELQRKWVCVTSTADEGVFAGEAQDGRENCPNSKNEGCLDQEALQNNRADDVDLLLSGLMPQEDDDDIVNLAEDRALINFINQSAAFPTSPYFQAYGLGADELRILTKTNALLNSSCINGLSALLQRLFTRDPLHSAAANRCVIFSTYDLVRIDYKASDAELWRNTYRTEFWSKDTWIIPIHRQSQCHWVLAVVYLSSGRIHLFDSLAGRVSQRDIRNISIFISRLFKLATRHGHSIPMSAARWTAQPAATQAVQTNAHDCGLWVLIWIAAILRGYGTIDGAVSEETMPTWRIALRNLVSAVSSSK